MKSNSTKKLKTKFFFFLSLINFFIVIISYNLLPVIMNYPPYAKNNLAFQNEVETFNHIQQYAFVFVLATSICYITINILMKNIYYFFKLRDKHQEIPQKLIKIVRKDCANVPYIFYISEISICLLLAFLLMIFLNNSNIFLLKYSMALLAIIALTSLLQFIFLQINLKKVSLLTYNSISNFEKNTGFRINFSASLSLQIIPFLLVSIIIISLFGYAKTSSEKANSIATYYRSHFENIELSNVSLENLKENLDQIPLYDTSDYYLIISFDNNTFYTSNNNEKISNFFLNYLKYFFNDTKGIIYEYYGYEKQACMIDLVDENGKTWYVGFEYNFTDYTLMYSYVAIMLAISILYGFFLFIVSRNISSNISTISESLENISKDNEYISKKFLPITSNDEFGDLAYSYNKIVDLTNQHLKEIQENQDILVEQERLVSLGQMIGGIAHNLKTPIFSVSGGLEGLSDLVNEFDESIGNQSVTNSDMHDIASDMREWITKLKGHMSYMSDVITAVKGQTVAMSENVSIEFSITELFKRVNILMKHELQNSLATLEIKNNVGDENILQGNINSLVQIINNIISNAIEAYGDDYTDKKVELSANFEDEKIVISIKDYGPGISETVQEKLFKEMITTKGKNGTGLGMFISYSNIKAHFNGKLTYDTVIGQGTTFYITLPILSQTEQN